MGRAGGSVRTKEDSDSVLFFCMKGGGGDVERLPKIMGTPGAVQGAKLQANYRHLFAEEEVVEIGFKTPAEVFIFTDRRMILAQRLGLMGRLGECHSLRSRNFLLRRRGCRQWPCYR